MSPATVKTDDKVKNYKRIFQKILSKGFFFNIANLKTF